MRSHRLVLAMLLASGALPALAQTPAAPALDFEFFKARVQPLLTTKRDGNARCVSCHGFGTTMRLQPLPEGAATWSEADARKNFELVSARVVAGDPDDSRLLLHPLAEDAGGDRHHDGGKHWTSKSDPEWQTLAAWVRGATLRARRPPAPLEACASSRPTAPATTSTSSTPPPTRSSARSRGIEVGHGAAAAPDGSRLYVSNEADSTLDVVDARTLRVTSQSAADGPPEQHLDQPRRPRASTSPSVRRLARWTSSTRRRCSASRASRSRATCTTPTSRPTAGTSIAGSIAGKTADRDRPADRGAGVGHAISISACGRWRSSRMPTARRSACSCS